MLWTDFMGRVNMVSKWVLCCALLSVNLVSQLEASDEAPLGTLVCDDQINVSLSITCEAVITVGMVLEGESQIPNYDPANYDVDIEGVNSNILTEVGVYTVTITERNPPFAPPLNSCWGHILVEDKLPPVIDPNSCNCSDPLGLANPDCVLPLLCNDLSGNLSADLDVPMPIAIDNCTEVTTSYYDSVADNGDCSSTIVTRIWVFTDGGGNQIESCPFYYRISPITLSDDIIGPESSVHLNCGVGTSPQEIYDYFDAKYREDYPCDDSPHNICDPFSPYYDQDFAEQYEEDVRAYALSFSYPVLGGIPLINNICNTATTFTDVVLPICSYSPECRDNNKVIRTWKIYDWCNVLAEPLEYIQIIKAADTEPPHIEVASFTASVDPWGCQAAIYFPDPIHLDDDCSTYVNYDVTSDYPGIEILYNPTNGQYYAHNVPVGEYTFYYNAYDCCENVTSAGVIVTVKDNTPPVAITKQDIVVSLIPNHGYQGSQGLTKVFTESIDNGSWDGCSDVKLEIRRASDYCAGYNGNLTYNDDGHSFDDDDDPDGGQYVSFCCSDLYDHGIDSNGDGAFDYALIKVWLRVWDDGDGNGEYGTYGDNYSEVWSYVRLEDKNRPDLNCPPDITIDCKADEHDLNLVGRAIANGPCGPVAVDYEDIDDNMTSCNVGTLLRRWYVVGQPDIFCYQHITKSGHQYGGAIITFPNDTVATCLDDLDEVPTWTGGHCDLFAYSVNRDTFFFEEGACFKIINYWTVIDWCIYDPNDPHDTYGVWNDIQVVKIIDNTGPVFDACEDQLFYADDKQDLDADNITCENNNVVLTNMATDNGDCASYWLKWTVHVDLYDDGNVEYTFSSSVNPSSPLHVSRTSSGEEVQVLLPEGVLGSMANHRVVWRVTDGCGNYSTCTSYFMVVDNIPPTPYCVNLSTALMENGQVELWACDFDLGSFDNCSDNSNLRFTFSDVPPQSDPNYNPQTQCSSKIFTCDDIIDAGGYVVTLDVYVWDEKNNYDFCSVFLTLVDNQDPCDDIGNKPTAQIGGTILTEHGVEIENVEVNINSTQPAYPSSKMTDASGHYMFAKNDMYENYELSGYKNDSPLNGVSTLDLVLIQKHVLGIESLDSPYKMIAADVNSDGNISAIDLLELRKLILGVYDEFPDNTSWRFVEESSIPNPAYPWSFGEKRVIENLSNNMMQEDFIGVKIGDVNNTVQANHRPGSDSDTEKKIVEIDFNDHIFKAGDIFETSLSLVSEHDISGIQFTLNSNDLEIVQIRENGIELKESNFALLSSDLTTFSWNAEDLVSVKELVTIQFRALADGSLSNNLSITSDVTKAEVYVGEQYEIIPLLLTGRNNPEHTFDLYQNNPNPFSNNTVIRFNLPETSEVTLSIMDVTGRLVMTTSGVYNKGINDIEISSRDLKSKGILYYRLDAGMYSATKKMIIIE